MTRTRQRTFFGLLLFALAVLAAVVPRGTAQAYCADVRHWAGTNRPYIPVYVVNEGKGAFNEDTIGMSHEEFMTELLSAMQRWNEAGTGAKPLVFAGYVDGRPCNWKNKSITVVARSKSVLGERTRGVFRSSISKDKIDQDKADHDGQCDDDVLDKRGELALVKDNHKTRWKRDPSLKVHRNLANRRSDLQAVIVHELGHALGLSHPWLATEVDTSLPNVAPDRCFIGQGPSSVRRGATLGVMSYLSRIPKSVEKKVWQGVRRFPWKDDIVGVQIAEGLRVGTGVACKATESCAACPPERPDCDPDRLSCVFAGDGANKMCLDDAECEGAEFCEREVAGVKDDGTGLESCSSDAQCSSSFACDLQSGLCVRKLGVCRKRSCVLAESRAFPVASWTHVPLDDPPDAWTGPVQVPLPGEDLGGVETALPPSVSDADDMDGRRTYVATVNSRNEVEVAEMLDGQWCEQEGAGPVIPGPDGTTYAPPAIATGGGRTMVAWLARESFDSFGTWVHFALRESPEVTWSSFGAIKLSGQAKRVGLGYSEANNRFVLTYLSKKHDGQVAVINPKNLEVKADQDVAGRPLNEIGSPICVGGGICWVPHSNTSASPGFFKGEVDGLTYDKDVGSLGELQVQGVGRVAGYQRGADPGQDIRMLYTDQGDLVPGERRWREVRTGTEDPSTLPNVMGGSVLDWTTSEVTHVPLWAGDVGSYASTVPGDALRLLLVRAAPVGPAVPAIPGTGKICCDCGPTLPEDDKELSGCGDLDANAGQEGCPCLDIETSPGAIQDCALAGNGPNVPTFCDPITPDGAFPDKYCPDSGIGDLVCDRTAAGNSICRRCGTGEDRAQLGCPCDEVDCEVHGLGCWQEGFGGAVNLADGRCWDQDEPPDYVCIEDCRALDLAENGFRPVCVGPHLGEPFEQGSPYNLTNGAFSGHAAYCTSVDCSWGGDPYQGGFCEENSGGQEICVADDLCGVECQTTADCQARGYPSWYGCAGQGVNRCLPISACDGKPGQCP